MFKYILFTAFTLFTLSSLPLLAQHEHHQATPAPARQPAATTKPAAQPSQNKPAPVKKKPTVTSPQSNQHQHESASPAPTTPDTTHQHHQMAPGGQPKTTAPTDTTHNIHQMTHDMAGMHDMPGMTHAFSRSLPMNRNGSGTAWNPDETPMYMYMKHAGKWNMMFHGSVYLRYTSQDMFNAGSRGDTKFDAPNWFMAMIQRPVGKRGLFNFNAMLSLDPLTEGKAGYPLLFQSGETYQGRRLVDRQHPHDFFSELSVAYTHQINPDIDITGYFGLPGEPALGPVAFMHRISSFNNPNAALGHHWQDATHITFGVATLGVRYKKWKLEGSNFTGREPDENRFGIDKPLFDSYAYRLSFNPTRTLALQVSRGYIHAPEALEPD